MQSNPASAAARLLLGRVLANQNNLQAAIDQFQQAQKLAPRDPAPLLQLASAYALQKKNAEADRAYQAALQIAPDSMAVLGPYAEFLLQHGQGSKAVSLIQHRIDADAKDTAARLALGTIYIEQKNYPAAEAQLNQVLAMDPKNVSAYMQLGKVQQETGQVDAAIQRYEKARAMQPKFVPLLTMLGDLYLAKGDLGRARKYYEDALAINPNFAVAASNLAWVSTKDGSNLDVALNLAQKAKQIMPEVPAISDTLGWVHYKKGNYSLAVPLFEQCVQTEPAKGIYHYHLGMALMAAGEPTKAKQELDAALRMNLSGDDQQQAREALARLH